MVPNMELRMSRKENEDNVCCKNVPNIVDFTSLWYLFAKQSIFIFTFKYQRLLFFCRYDLYINPQFVEIKQSKLVNRHSSSFKPNWMLSRKGEKRWLWFWWVSKSHGDVFEGGRRSSRKSRLGRQTRRGSCLWRRCRERLSWERRQNNLLRWRWGKSWGQGLQRTFGGRATMRVIKVPLLEEMPGSFTGNGPKTWTI